jgi:alkanesulfonate monooxygenase SsuD/methylene tetrahydromethanopterin reductase-like flavin-dependent oxidoreductase (luciferase family)
MRFGIQLYPPCTAPEMAAHAKRAMAQYAFDKVWVPDHLTYENVFVILAAIIGQTDAHVGTSVVQPFSRTPVDLASSFAALAHLAGERGITVGIGAGSPSSNMIRKYNRVGMTRETILFLREMFAGRKTALGQFPALAEFFHLDRWRKPSCACRRQDRRIFSLPPPDRKCLSWPGTSAMA